MQKIQEIIYEESHVFAIPQDIITIEGMTILSNFTPAYKETI